MEFRLESEMIPPLHSWLGTRTDEVKREFRTPWGYCDLAGCSISRTRAAMRLRWGQLEQVGSIADIDLLWQIPDECSGDFSSLPQLMDEYSQWATIDEIADAISELVRKGFVVRHEGGRLQKRTRWYPLHKKLIAVEAKLHRIEESMWQAASHLHYADESYVALPSSRASKTAESGRRDRFHELGLGLLSVSSNRVRVLIKSGNQSPVDPILQVYAVERFWQTYATSRRA